MGQDESKNDLDFDNLVIEVYDMRTKQVDVFNPRPKEMSDNFIPTMRLRWAEKKRGDRKPPYAIMVDYGKWYFKLQQWWKAHDSEAGEWRDIPVEYVTQIE